MKAKTSFILPFVIGAITASLPFTLSIGRTNAQDASRLKPKHTPVIPDHVEISDGYVYIVYRGQITRIPSSSVPTNGWQKLPDTPIN